MGTDIELSRLVKDTALQFCTSAEICDVAVLAKPKLQLQKRIESGLPHDLSYLARNPDMRCDITKWYPKARSILLCAFQYWNSNSDDSKTLLSSIRLSKLRELRKVKRQDELDKNKTYKVSRYALVQDYHKTIKVQLKTLLKQLQNEIPNLEGKIFCDDSPVFEKALAVKAGLGWQGKHSLILNEKNGSFFFIGGMALSLDLKPTSSNISDKCGDCRKCIEACPTGAIENGYLNQKKCLSYFTTANKDLLPKEIEDIIHLGAQGCDICQTVCPHNRNISTPICSIFKLHEL
jgi:epoxyqueuosine reductase QueG